MTEDERQPPGNADDSAEKNQDASRKVAIPQSHGTPSSDPTQKRQANPDANPKTSRKLPFLSGIRDWWNHPGRQKPNVAEWITVSLTAAIVLVGGMQACIYRQQKQIMESSGHQTDQLITAANIQACASQKNAAAAASFAGSAAGINTHTQNAVDEFKRLAAASEGNIEAIRESARLEQRAWISTNVSSLPTIDQDTKTLTITVTATNSGKTFALRTVISAHASFANHEITTDEELKRGTTSAPPASIALLAPGVPYESPVDIPTEELPRIINRLSGGGYTYVWGDISYSDVFKRHHTTEYCGYRKEPPKTNTSIFQCTFHTDAN